jgi:hypothetical protein
MTDVFRTKTKRIIAGLVREGHGKFAKKAVKTAKSPSLSAKESRVKPLKAIAADKTPGD